MRYRELDHPTDLYLEVRRKTKRSVFASTAAALFDVLREGARRKPDKTLRIEAEGADPEDLLVRFLNETISLAQAKGVDPVRFRVRKLGKTYVEAEAACASIDPESPPGEVKAATYHGLDFRKMPRGDYRARVLFDM